MVTQIVNHRVKINNKDPGITTLEGLLGKILSSGQEQCLDGVPIVLLHHSLRQLMQIWTNSFKMLGNMN